MLYFGEQLLVQLAAHASGNNIKELKVKKNQKNFWVLPALVLFVGLNFVACAIEEEENEGSGSISIAGTWDGEYGDTIVISSTQWVKTEKLGADPKEDYSMDVLEYDNDSGIVYVMGKALSYGGAPDYLASETTDDTYERYRWYKADSTTMYECDEVYGGTSLEEVKADTTDYPFDPDDPTSANCGGFAYTKYTKVE